jgi:hypothetical protein
MPSNTPAFKLERKEVGSASTVQHRSRFHTFTPTTMHTASRVLPMNTPNSTVDIPAAAFAPLVDEVRDRFNVELRVHKHRAGVNHGRFVPLDHYLVELRAASPEQIEEAIEAIDARVDALVERFSTTNSNTEVPAGR